MTDYTSFKEKVDVAVMKWCADAQDELGNAVKYALDGGKRLRPVMLLAANKVARGRESEAMPFAVALELIHNYSLIHDDMPCMDNDILRRGRPTVHKKFGEWMALLTGDALLNGAYELILENLNNIGQVRAARIIADAAGTRGMIRGQFLDLSPKKHRTSEEISTINRYKTGALFVAALTAGATLAGANSEIITALTTYGINFGEAFQIYDDLDDYYTLPKNDKKLKNNYAVIYGEKCAKEDLSNFIADAKKSIENLKNNKILLEILNLI